MPVDIRMPALSPTMEKGNLAKWVKKEGDKVKAGDVIAEIETDKATMEYESIDDGILAKIVVPEGSQDVPVNALIAVLAEEGEDPKAAAAGKSPPPAKTASPPAARPMPTVSDDRIRALFEPGTYEVVPHDNVRRIIARRLVEAKQTIPHFYLTLDCNIGKLLAAREEINATAPKDKDGKPSYKLSVNDFVIKALALALQRVPDANVTWTEEGML